MKILIVSATKSEIEPFLNQFKNEEITVLITGVGMVATAYSLGKQLAGKQYNLAINAGIAGSFDRTLKIGDVVEITEDLFAELGAEDGDSFLSIDELGLGKQIMKPIHLLSNQRHLLQNYDLKKVNSITVNRIHGNEMSILKTIDRFHPHTESMEGAAFFYACNQAALPSMQIRSISNYIERRSRETWDIGLAIKNLNEVLINMLINSETP